MPDKNNLVAIPAMQDDVEEKSNHAKSNLSITSSFKSIGGDNDPTNDTTNLGNNISLVFEKTSPAENVGERKKDISLIPDSTTTNQRFSPLWRQVLATSGSIMATLSAGMTSGFSATLLPQLSQPDSPIHLTTETSSWIASIAALPMSIGCIISGLIMEPCGRRLTHQLLTIPFLLGWVLIATANGLPQILVGRFMTGLCVGLLGPVGSIYIGEISSPKYRGFLLAGISFAISFGLLLVHLIGTFCTWQLTAAICAIVPFISFIIMSFVPESPSWLLRNKKPDKAIKAFCWLRGHDPKSLEELNAMLKKHAETSIEIHNRPVSYFSKETLHNLIQTFRRPEFYKPLMIMTCFFFTLQLSGVNAVAFYSVSIMKSTLGSSFNEYAAMIIIDIVRLVMSIVACVLLRVVGRRPLAMTSGTFTSLSLLGLSMYAYITSKYDSDYASQSWIPLTLLIIFMVATTAGITPLPWVMTGEVFPIDLRGIGSGICTAMCFVSFFAVVKLAPEMFRELGVEGTFMTYGVMASVGMMILYFFLPETKGYTLQDIEERFKNTNQTSSMTNDRNT